MKCKSIFLQVNILIVALLLGYPVTGGAAEKPLKLAYAAPTGSLYDVAAQKFVDRIATNTKGKVTIKVFGNSQFGNPHEHWAQVKGGAIDMHMIDVGAVSMVEEEPKNFSILAAPYLFDSQAAFKAFCQSGLFNVMMAKVEKSHNIKYLGYFGDNAPRGFSTTKRKVVTPEDMKGLKLRVPQVPMFVSIFKAWGATPTPVAPNEVYIGIKTGMVDGMDLNVVQIYLAKYHEIQKYYTALDYMYSAVGCWMNADKWTSLDEETAQAFHQSVMETAAYVDTFTANQIHEAEQGFATAGVEIIRPDLTPWKAIVENQNMAFEGNLWEMGLYDKIKAQQ